MEMFDFSKDFPLTKIVAIFLESFFSQLDISGVKELTPMNAKAARKSLKRTTDVSLVLLGCGKENRDDVMSLIQYVRKGLHNNRTRIVVLANEKDELEYADVLTCEGADNVILNIPENRKLVSELIKAELRTYQKLLRSEIRREMEIRILTTLGKMSRESHSDNDCVLRLSELLLEATGAHTSQIFFSQNGERPKADIPDHCSSDMSDLGRGPWTLVQAALRQHCQQLCIDNESADHKRSSKATAASIALPLQCYEHTVAVLHLLLPPESMENLTVEFVELLGKLAEQVRILFERRASEGELETQFERVKNTLRKLEKTQMKLYQSEKLASVGQLAAGIAHEINNPITFLAGNMRPLEDYTDAMSSMLEMHQEFLKEIDDSTPRLRDLAETRLKPMAEELDIAFVMEDVRSLVSESKEGLQRVTDIVQNLTRFARKDSVECTPGSLESGLDDTIRMLKHEIKGSVEILRDYCKLPDVVCSHGLVNQVFLNLMKNASHAIGSQGTISVKTEIIVDDSGAEVAKVSIMDDGDGIPDAIKERIFEPFFTTKPAGEGTGLGLSMCYDIIDRHGGELSFTSEQGKGTEFVVTLPFVSSVDTEVDTKNEEKKVA